MIDINIDLEKVIVVIISGIIAIISSIIAYKLSIRKAKKDFKTQIFFKQKFEYFLKLKYSARELRGRIWQIKLRLFMEDDREDKMQEKKKKDASKDEKLLIDKKLKEKKTKKRDDMISRFKKNDISKDLKWFFDDSIDSGGYYLFSTVYLQCMLFYGVQKIASEYPYISLKLKNDSSVPNLKKRTNISHFLKEIKKAISGFNGIPYGIIDSVGEFMLNGEKSMNYEEFCKEIIEDESRIKFNKVISFWQNLCSSGNDIEGNVKLEKIVKLYEILHELDQYDVDDMR